jgi:hypothetical protein
MRRNPVKLPTDAIAAPLRLREDDSKVKEEREI